MLNVLGTFFCLLCGARKNKKLFQLTIQDQYKNMYFIKAKANTRIEEIKSYCGVQSERSSLYLEKTLLEDGTQLKEYEITEDAHLYLFLNNELQ